MNESLSQIINYSSDLLSRTAGVTKNDVSKIVTTFIGEHFRTAYIIDSTSPYKGAVLVISYCHFV